MSMVELSTLRGCDEPTCKVNRSCLRSWTTMIIEFIVVLILLASYLSTDHFSQPTIEYLTCDQTDILKPLKPNTISTASMIIVGNTLPVVIIIFVEYMNSNKGIAKKKCSCCNGLLEYSVHAIMLFWMGQFTTVLITEASKRWVGRLRPHFMAVCKPRLELINCYNKTNTGRIFNSIYTGGDFCTGDPRLVNEARLSFPSGHASFTAFVLIYVIIFLEARLLVNRTHYIKCLLQITSLVCSLIISLSRISDFQHRPSDVMGGYFLGLFIASMCAYYGKRIWSYNRYENCFEFKAINDDMSSPGASIL